MLERRYHCPSSTRGDSFNFVVPLFHVPTWQTSMRWDAMNRTKWFCARVSDGRRYLSQLGEKVSRVSEGLTMLAFLRWLLYPAYIYGVWGVRNILYNWSTISRKGGTFLRYSNTHSVRYYTSADLVPVNIPHSNGPHFLWFAWPKPEGLVLTSKHCFIGRDEHNVVCIWHNGHVCGCSIKESNKSTSYIPSSIYCRYIDIFAPRTTHGGLTL